MAEGCKQFRVMDSDEWDAIHSAHGTPTKTLNEHQPPRGSYRLYTLTCPCGAKHVVHEDND